jgi:hypothetical protein
MGRREVEEERQKAAGLVQQAYSGGYEHPIEVGGGGVHTARALTLRRLARRHGGCGNEQWTSRTTHTGDDVPFLSSEIYIRFGVTTHQGSPVVSGEPLPDKQCIRLLMLIQQKPVLPLVGGRPTNNAPTYKMLRYPWPRKIMRIPHRVSISFPPRDAHEKISSTCAKISTILSVPSPLGSILPPSLMMPLQRLRIACGRGPQRRVRRLCHWSRLRLALCSSARAYAYIRLCKVDPAETRTPLSATF